MFLFSFDFFRNLVRILVFGFGIFLFCKAKAFESQLNQEVEKRKEKQRKEVLRIEIERTVWLVENINKNGFRLNCVGFFW